MPRRKGGKSGRKRKGRKNTKKSVFSTGPDRGKFSLSPLVPAITRIRLKYPVSKILASGVPTSSVRFTPNGAYDIDPTLGSTALPGFIEWTSFYGFYRVLGVGYKVMAVSLESSKPCSIYTCMLNSDPGTTLSAIIQGNALTKVQVLGINSGEGKTTLSGYAKVSSILGSKTSLTADSYRAVTTANPADVVWIGIGASTLDGGNFASGIALRILLTIDIEFYDRIQNFGSYSERVQAEASNLLNWDVKRDLWKRNQGQVLDPCSDPREVSPQYFKEQTELFRKAHPGI